MDESRWKFVDEVEEAAQNMVINFELRLRMYSRSPWLNGFVCEKMPRRDVGSNLTVLFYFIFLKPD